MLFMGDSGYLGAEKRDAAISKNTPEKKEQI